MATMMTIYGYMRVSTKEQNEDRQRTALVAYGIPEERIFFDKQSGKDFNRPAYQQLFRELRPGDLLVIPSIDRLGRDYEETLVQWKRLTKDKETDIQVLDMPLLDTRTHKDFLGSFISDLVLQVLSFVAQNERDMIRKRQAEGIAAAKARGVQFGNRKKPLPDNFPEIYAQWQEGVLSCETLAVLCGVHRSTLYRRLREMSND